MSHLKLLKAKSVIQNLLQEKEKITAASKAAGLIY